MNKGKKKSGGMYHAFRKKKSREQSQQARKAVLGDTKRKGLRGHGGSHKTIVLSTNVANLAVGGKMKKVTITNVVETPQNVFLARQNRLAKGVIIETTVGKARITNRPSQEGNVNAVLVEE